METSRTKNTKKNIISGLIKQFSSLLLAFIIRTVILYYLGAEYQGLNGLFTSILQMLNLTDLGFSTAIMYILYKPIAQDDKEAIRGIVNYLKKIYLIVGLAILVLGICIMPFLRYLISSDIPDGINIYVLFAIYLLNSSLSYMLFAYKSAYLSALQKESVVSNAFTLTSIFIKIVQLVLLISFKNYYIYVLTLPIGTALYNIAVQIASKKISPDIFPKGTIPNDLKQNFKKQVKAIFIGKISDVARNSLDNIVLSAFLGLVAVAIYDNYYYIYSAIYGIMGIIIHGMMASVGNSIATESKEKNYTDLKKFNFIFMIIVGWCSICMLCLYQPFMLIWMKNDQTMLFDNRDMFLFCFYFYAINMTYVRSMYLDGYGLFHECRYWCVIEAVSNLVLNIALGYFFGITGIIVATIITIIVFNFICRSNVLFKYYFNFSPKEFYFEHIIYLLVTTGIALLTYFVCSLLPFSGVYNLLLRLALCIVIPLIAYLVIYCRTKHFKEMKSIVKRLIH